MARNSDGRLELLIAEPVTRPRVLTLLPILMKGQHIDEPEIHTATASKLTVTAAAAVPSHLDGEVQPPASRFEIDVLPAALDIL